MAIPPQTSSPQSLPPKAPNGTTMVVVGLALATLAVILVNVYAQALVKKSQPDTFTAYTFIGRAEAGRTVSPDMFAPTEIPEKFKNSLGPLVDSKESFEALFDDKKSKPLKHDAFSGQLLTHDFFKGGKEADPKLDPITPGKLGVSITVDKLPASLIPGDYVELRVAVPAGNGKPGTRVIGLMEYVRVIAKGDTVISQDGTSAKGGAGTTTLEIELTPEQDIQIKNIQRAIGGAPLGVSVRSRNASTGPYNTVPDITQINPEVFKALGITAYQASFDEPLPAPAKPKEPAKDVRKAPAEEKDPSLFQR